MARAGDVDKSRRSKEEGKALGEGEFYSSCNNSSPGFLTHLHAKDLYMMQSLILSEILLAEEKESKGWWGGSVFLDYLIFNDLQMQGHIRLIK